ncbi:MAG: type II toxin-antitoxin system death-on-curing family toxin [Armatimonadota bacterium]
MTAEPRFLAVEHVLAIHRRVIAEFGGDSTALDEGLLESAVAMPGAQFDGEYLHPDLPSMAAAYLYHLCKGHPFVDGNKRTALVAAEVFLLLNGRRLKATNRELERLTFAIAQGTLSKDDATAFVRQHTAG